MKKFRVLVLMHQDLMPPEKLNGLDWKQATWRTEYNVIQTLKALGHDVFPLGVLSDLGVIRYAVDTFKPHIAFNLLEEFDGVAVFDQNVVSYLELLKLGYTGCGPRGLMIARDKALTKKILTFHRIDTPKFIVLEKNHKIQKPKNLNFPLIIKSLTEESSTGISQASIVRDEGKFLERVKFIHEKVGTDCIAESFIEGRELYVSIIGNSKLTVFPIWEMVFKSTPEDMEKIATSKVKINPEYRKKYGIDTQEAKDLSPEMIRKIQHVCKRAFKLLDLEGYARMDLRLTPDGKVFIIEANPNPDISKDEDFAYSAKESGLSYKDLISKILTLGYSKKPDHF